MSHMTKDGHNCRLRRKAGNLETARALYESELGRMMTIIKTNHLFFAFPGVSNLGEHNLLTPPVVWAAIIKSSYHDVVDILNTFYYRNFLGPNPLSYYTFKAAFRMILQK